jgi:UPF0716 protein FxsA
MLSAFLLGVAALVLEAYVFVQISHAIGWGDAVVLLLVVSLVGAQLVKRQGLSAWRRIQESLAYQQVPGKDLIDGFLILLAGALLLVPGFVSSAIGLLLLIPPVRRLCRAAGGWALARRVGHQIERW